MMDGESRVVGKQGRVTGKIGPGLVVLNGAQGIEAMLAKALTLGGTGLGLARSLLNGATPALLANGTTPEAAKGPTETTP
jgi:flotillin